MYLVCVKIYKEKKKKKKKKNYNKEIDINASIFSKDLSARLPNWIYFSTRGFGASIEAEFTDLYNKETKRQREPPVPFVLDLAQNRIC